MSSFPATTVPDARKDPSLRRYELRRVRLPMGGGTLSLVLPDARDWIRRGEWSPATERGAEPPYWVQIWPASVAVARLLVRHGALAGKRVLDLGCGLGVPGIAAASAGAAVTFADRQPDALAFARWNGVRAATGPAPECRELDWAHTTVAGTFDVVVLADVSYRPVHHPALRRHLAQCLAPGGVVVHADPHRPEATPFVKWLASAHTALVVSRSTACFEQRTDVRLCVAARDAEAVAPWRATLGEVATAAPAADT